jgi:hypothetical protein
MPVRKITIEIKPSNDISKGDELEYHLEGFASAADVLLAMIEVQRRIVSSQKLAAMAAQQTAAMKSGRGNNLQKVVATNRRA